MAEESATAAMTSESTCINIKQSKYLIISSECDMSKTWKIWLQQFECYATTTNLSARNNEVQNAIFIAIIGSDAGVINDSFKLTEKE